MDFCGGDRRMKCSPGKSCLTCPNDGCTGKASIPMTREESAMYHASIEKGSAKGATSTEPVNKTSIYIIPQLRHMKPVAQNEARTYKIPKDCIEMWLRSVYGLKCQPVVAPLKDKAKFRREITKESGLYVDC